MIFILAFENIAEKCVTKCCVVNVFGHIVIVTYGETQLCSYRYSSSDHCDKCSTALDTVGRTDRCRRSVMKGLWTAELNGRDETIRLTTRCRCGNGWYIGGGDAVWWHIVAVAPQPCPSVRQMALVMQLPGERPRTFGTAGSDVLTLGMVWVLNARQFF